MYHVISEEFKSLILRYSYLFVWYVHFPQPAFETIDTTQRWQQYAAMVYEK